MMCVGLARVHVFVLAGASADALWERPIGLSQSRLASLLLANVPRVESSLPLCIVEPT
jgi:hypothetical protein